MPTRPAPRNNAVSRSAPRPTAPATRPATAAKPAPIITARYRVPVREQLGKIPALNRGTLFSNGAGAFFAVFAAVSVVQRDTVQAIVGVAFALALVSGYYCVPFGWLSLRGHRDAAEAPVDLTVDDEGIHLASYTGVLDVPWTQIALVRETKSCFFVYARYPRAFFLPGRAFDPAALDAFRRLAASKTRLQG